MGGLPIEGPQGRSYTKEEQAKMQYDASRPQQGTGDLRTVEGITKTPFLEQYTAKLMEQVNAAKDDVAGTAYDAASNVKSKMSDITNSTATSVSDFALQNPLAAGGIAAGTAGAAGLGGTALLAKKLLKKRAELDVLTELAKEATIISPKDIIDDIDASNNNPIFEGKAQDAITDIGKSLNIVARHPGLLYPDSPESEALLNEDKAQSALVYGTGAGAAGLGGTALLAKKLLKKRAELDVLTELAKEAGFGLSNIGVDVPTDYEVNINAPRVSDVVDGVDAATAQKLLASLAIGGAVTGASVSAGAGLARAPIALRNKILKK